jgi:hypothetical protein
VFEEDNEAAEVSVEYLGYFLADFAQEFFGVFDGLRLSVEVLFVNKVYYD